MGAARIPTPKALRPGKTLVLHLQMITPTLIHEAPSPKKIHPVQMPVLVDLSDNESSIFLQSFALSIFLPKLIEKVVYQKSKMF